MRVLPLLAIFLSVASALSGCSDLLPNASEGPSPDVPPAALGESGDVSPYAGAWILYFTVTNFDEDHTCRVEGGVGVEGSPMAADFDDGGNLIRDGEGSPYITIDDNGGVTLMVEGDGEGCDGGIGTGTCETTSHCAGSLATGGVYSAWRFERGEPSDVPDAGDKPVFTRIPVGATIAGAAILPDGMKAIVTISGDPGLIKLFSLPDGIELASLEVGRDPGQIAVTSDGAKAIVAHRAAFTIVDLATFQVLATVPAPCVADTIYGIAIAPGNQYAVAAVFGANCHSTKLGTIDLNGYGLGAITPLPANGYLPGVAVSPDGATAVFTMGVTGSAIKRMDLATGGITMIANTSSTFGVAFMPAGAEILVASGPGETVKRISLESGLIVAEFDFGSDQGVHNLAITPDGKTAVVAGYFKTGFISLQTGVVDVVERGGSDVTISADGTLALVASYQDLFLYPL